MEKYGRGKCSKEEIALVESWMQSAEEDLSIFKDVPITEELNQRLRKDLKRRTFNTIPQESVSLPSKGKWLVAASLLLLFGLGAYLFFAGQGALNTTYTTVSGQVRTITLEDGSRIVLNAMSRLVVPSDFGQDNRNVTLQGEAYFEVQRDSLLPFVVKTDSTTTTVLGTKFNLSAYEREASVLVLKEGKVSFSHLADPTNSPIIVLPNEEVRFLGGVLHKQRANTDYAVAWTSKRLVFPSQKFSEVIGKVERFYGINISIRKKSLEDRIYRGNHNDPSLTELLESMAFVLKFKYKKEGDTVVIY